MAAPTTPFTIAKPTGGVLPISAVTTQANTHVNGVNKSAAVPASRLKVVIRRLPPGLEEAELQVALGDEWTVGKGKVDWALFRRGKVSKDLAKPSRPARAYLHVTASIHLDALAEKVRQTPFTDARNTSSDSVLLGPPILEFAPYNRVPAGKKRNDARQGLIDQDPEFIEFLESLTNPVTKLAVPDSGAEDRKGTTAIVTPLIQHLRDRKVAKDAAKEKSAAAKAAKQVRVVPKNETAETKKETDGSTAMKEVAKSPEKKNARVVKVERPSKLGTKGITTTIDPKPSASSSTTSDVAKAATESVSKKIETQAPGAAAARMLQRDLGMRGRGGSLRRGTRSAAESTRPLPSANAVPTLQPTADAQNTSLSTAPAKASATVPAPFPSAASVVQAKAPASPAIMKRAAPARPPVASAQLTKPVPKVAAAPAPTAVAPPPQTTRPPPAPSTATHAFLKHANPSQGITETLLEEAMLSFGAITKVEIDKRKGFAYIEFAEPAGLQKAIAASPVKIAQGSVQVLERKDRGVTVRLPPVVAGPTRGGGMVGRGGVAVGAVFRGGRGGGRGRGGVARGGAASNTISTVPVVLLPGSAAPSTATATPTVDPASAPAPTPATPIPAAAPPTAGQSG